MMAKRKRRRKRRKNPSALGWIEIVAALASLGLIGVGQVLARAEVRRALMVQQVPDVSGPELMVRAGAVIGIVAGGYALVTQPETTAKIVAGLGALTGASFLIAPGWPYMVGASNIRPLNLPAPDDQTADQGA
jgi:hypothetical protein